MKRLIEAGLMFGNMVHVTSPVWVGRYNRALKRLTGRETKLTDFYVDVSGFSPEIADELDDPLYLNPQGVNRLFILLTPDQKRAPLLDAKFSFSRDVLRGFIEQNEAQLFALTTQDAVAGELVNSIFDADHPSALLEIRDIQIEADTPDGMLERAGDLSAKIDRFLSSQDAWQDDLEIADMISLAKDTGDIVRNPVTLSGLDHRFDHFWTAHFGGAFVFRAEEGVIIIAEQPKAFADLDHAVVIGIDQNEALAKFLFSANLVEPILQKKGPRGAEIVQRKMDMIVAYVAALKGEDNLPQESRALRRLARTYASDLPLAWAGLSDLHRWATDRGGWPKISADHPSYFYSLRAAAGPHRDLINRLLASRTELDLRQLFICHKENFYDRYALWPDALKEFATTLLARDYMSDKSAARDALFGPWDTGDTSKMTRNDLERKISAVGPWGAVRR